MRARSRSQARCERSVQRPADWSRVRLEELADWTVWANKVVTF